MCGILGQYLLLPSDNSAAKFNAALDQLAHRGPDFKADWHSLDQLVTLGHTRLAVLGISARANQPMHSDCGRFTLSFNGEIYNWESLKYALERKGQSFITDSDSEVLLRLFKLEGMACLQRLRGMFAFAIYDWHKRELWLARDPIGKKPLLYSQNSAGFYFASELPALLKLLPARPHLNACGLAQMLVQPLRNVPDPFTAYENVFRLLPGHYMLIKHGACLELQRYWKPWQRKQISSVEEVKNDIIESVSLRCRADVEVGVLLSGGIDSSLVTALASGLHKNELQSFGHGLNAEDPDLLLGQRAANHYSTRHHCSYFSPTSAFADFQELLKIYGDPFMLLPLVFAYQICQQVRAAGIKVALTGHGADELFNGYDGQLSRIWLSRLLRAGEVFHGPLRKFAGQSDWSWLLAAPGSRKARRHWLRCQQPWTKVLNQPEQLLNPDYSEVFSELGSLLPDAWLCDELNFTALIVDNQISLATAADLAGMACGIELRSPFMDSQLIESVFALQLDLRVPPLVTAESARKHLLRCEFSDLLPDWILRREKRGFGFEISEAGLLRGAWQEQANQIFADLDDLQGLLNLDQVRKYWQDFSAGRKSACAALVPKLFAQQLWARNCLN